MRLIDADELKKLRHDYIQGRIKFDGNEYDLIDKCPTLDAEPVRHGTWEEIETYAFVGFDGNGSLKERRQKYYRHICGRCSAIKEKFCPNCGAIMDGGDE